MFLASLIGCRRRALIGHVRPSLFAAVFSRLVCVCVCVCVYERVVKLNQIGPENSRAGERDNTSVLESRNLWLLESI